MRLFIELGLNYNNCPEGNSWQYIPDQFIRMKSISIGPNNVIWSISTDGELFVRSGVTKDCPTGHSWAPVKTEFNAIDPNSMVES